MDDSLHLRFAIHSPLIDYLVKKLNYNCQQQEQSSNLNSKLCIEDDEGLNKSRDLSIVFSDYYRFLGHQDIEYVLVVMCYFL